MNDRNRILLAVVFMLGSLSAAGQINRYMVFFKDKSGTPFTTSQPSQYLSEKAIERRVKQGITISELDLPVNSGYAQGVSSAGAKVFFSTRWMNAVLVQCDVSVIPSVQALPFVSRVEFVAPQQRLLSNGRKKGLFRRKKR